MGSAAKLAGVGLGTSWLNVLCFSILMGTNAAQETLTSQAWGANKHRLCGVYLNRGRIINTVIFIPQVLVLSFSYEILQWLGQDPEVCFWAQKYIFVSLPGMYFQGLFDLQKRWLNCM